MACKSVAGLPPWSLCSVHNPMFGLLSSFSWQLVRRNMINDDMQMGSCGSAVVTRPNRVCRNTPLRPSALHAHSLAYLGTRGSAQGVGGGHGRLYRVGLALRGRATVDGFSSDLLAETRYRYAEPIKRTRPQYAGAVHQTSPWPLQRVLPLRWQVGCLSCPSWLSRLCP